MTIETPTASVPAGWYPDPLGGGSLRWWDGACWTEHSHTPQVPLQSGSQHSGPVHSDPQPWSGIMTELDLGPAGQDPDAGISWVELGPPSTVWAWLLAFSPYIWGIVTGIAQAVIFTLSPPTGLGQIVPLGLAAMALGLVPGWIFAALDRRTLIARNYDGVPSVLWMLLAPPFAYLLRRRRAVMLEGERTRGLNIATLVVAILWGLNILAGVGLFVGGLVLTGLTVPGGISADGGGGDQSGYGIGVATPQESVAGPLAPDDGSPLYSRVESVLAPALGITDVQGGLLDCGSSESIIAIPSSFPCLAMLYPPDGSVSTFRVDVTIAADGTVSYTQQDPEVP